MAEPADVDADRGIYPKYLVFKHPNMVPEKVTAKWYADPYDNSPGAFHDGGNLELVDDFCFVLKPIGDKHARIAMAAYAESVKEEKPQLSRDIYEVLGDF